MFPSKVESPIALAEVAKDLALTKTLQLFLVDYKYLTGPVDGVLGPLTASAYSRFQYAHGIFTEEESLGNLTLNQIKNNPKKAPPLTLFIEAQTLFKRRPLQSSALDFSECVPFAKGREIPLVSWAIERDHCRITLAAPFQGFFDWFVYSGHVKISEGSKVQSFLAKPEPVRLNVPYRSQLDNWFNPGGSCNVTSLAMCLQYLGIRGRGTYPQLEDELYQYCLQNGLSRHSPEHLAIVVEDYGRKDDFTAWGTIERCQSHLKAGNPCVIHGYFTSFGHIIVLVGFDDKGFIVHDPYGEWTERGYNTKVSGANLHYSYNLIRRTCIPDGQFWVHYLSR